MGNKKRADINDSSKMLNNLLNRKRAPSKKRKKQEPTTKGKYENNMKICIKLCVLDSTNFECNGCSELREQLEAQSKRIDRFERVLPAVKQFFRPKTVNMNFLLIDMYTVGSILDWLGNNDGDNNTFFKN
jgi:hypothetical protein